MEEIRLLQEIEEDLGEVLIVVSGIAYVGKDLCESGFAILLDKSTRVGACLFLGIKLIDAPGGVFVVML